MKRNFILVFAALAVGTLLGAMGERALSKQHIKVRPLLKTDLVEQEGRQLLIALLEVDGGASLPPHYHPGAEIGYVLEGSALVKYKGKPDQTVKAGDAYYIPTGQVHSATIAPSRARVLVIRLHEIGKPIRILAK